MTPEIFEQLMKRRQTHCDMVMNSKAHEYARDNERLHNFHTAAGMMKCTPERALWGMAMKHFVSLQDIIEDLDRSQLPTQAIIDEKIGDAINYLHLLEGLLVDRVVNAQAEKIQAAQFDSSKEAEIDINEVNALLNTFPHFMEEQDE